MATMQLSMRAVPAVIWPTRVAFSGKISQGPRADCYKRCAQLISPTQTAALVKGRHFRSKARQGGAGIGIGLTVSASAAALLMW